MSYDRSTRVIQEIHRVRCRRVCGTWYGDQACSEGIWNNAISDGVKRRVESDERAMGART
jgi:hypothetical protein